jgi:hypothetical protein
MAASNRSSRTSLTSLRALAGGGLAVIALAAAPSGCGSTPDSTSAANPTTPGLGHAALWTQASSSQDVTSCADSQYTTLVCPDSTGGGGGGGVGNQPGKIKQDIQRSSADSCSCAAVTSPPSGGNTQFTWQTNGKPNLSPPPASLAASIAGCTTGLTFTDGVITENIWACPFPGGIPDGPGSILSTPANPIVNCDDVATQINGEAIAKGPCEFFGVTVAIDSTGVGDPINGWGLVASAFIPAGTWVDLGPWGNLCDGRFCVPHCPGGCVVVLGNDGNNGSGVGDGSEDAGAGDSAPLN